MSPNPMEWKRTVAENMNTRKVFIFYSTKVLMQHLNTCTQLSVVTAGN